MPPEGARHILEESHLFEDSYRIVRELGRGGFGIIYLARQLSMDRLVALKVLKPGVCDLDPTARKRFLREVQIISKLRHPNTVTIHDFGQTDQGVVYMVLEYVDGEDLHTILQREGPQTPLRALGLTRQIARSLAEAHSHGVIHRDLTPANIMLTDLEGDSDFVKVLDFGVARLRDSDIDLTNVGVPDGQRNLMGTPRYMSPEQVRGEDLGPAADLYSLGLLLYEMLFAQPAVTGDTVLELIRQKNRNDPLALQGLDELDDPLSDLIRRATSKSKQRRFQSGKEFAEAIDDTAHKLNATGAQSASDAREFLDASGRFTAVSAPTNEPDADDAPDDGIALELDDGEEEDAEWFNAGFAAHDFADDQPHEPNGDEAFLPELDEGVSPPPSPDPTSSPADADNDLPSDDAGPASTGPVLIDNTSSSDPSEDSSQVALGVAVSQQRRQEPSSLQFGLGVFGLCILATVAALSSYILFLVIGALIGQYFGGLIRVAVAGAVAISIPFFAALNELQSRTRSTQPDSSAKRIARILGITTLVAVGSVAIASFAMPGAVIDDLREDPDGIFDDSALHRDISRTVADGVESSTSAVGRYDIEDTAPPFNADQPDFYVPPEPTRPATQQGDSEGTSATPPPTRPSTTGDDEDDRSP